MINIYSKYSVSSYLKNNNIAPSKSRGQNFLIDENTASRISNISLKARSKYALEIGGGLGSLTEKLFPIYEDKLAVVEFDRALYNHLNLKYNQKIKIIHKDILEIDLINDNILNENEDEKLDVYGNIPYNIASKILEWLFVKNYSRWNYSVMMVQKDFALRILAKEGTKDYSALTMFTNFMVSSKLEFNVSNKIFFPIPKVDSSVISFVPNNADKNIFPIYQLISKCLFHNRRKMAKNNLTNSPYINIESEHVSKMFESLCIDSKTRGEDISSDIVKQIAYYVYENNFLKNK